jgi:hypothetical protein
VGTIFGVQRGRRSLVHLVIHSVFHTKATEFFSDRAYRVEGKIFHGAHIIFAHSADKSTPRGEIPQFLLNQRIVGPVWVTYFFVPKDGVKSLLVFKEINRAKTQNNNNRVFGTLIALQTAARA